MLSIDEATEQQNDKNSQDGENYKMFEVAISSLSI